MDDSDDYFDFIIVGAGSAGCVVANRLSENKDWKILLLERGDEEPLVADVPAITTLLRGSSIDYNYTSQPEPQACANKPCLWTRGKSMGGTSVVNSMIYNRGHKYDYDNWANLGNPGWSWDDVLPYIKKSENLRFPEILEKYPSYHSTGGYQSVEPAGAYDKNARIMMECWKELGLKEVDYNSGVSIGTSRMQFITYNGARQSANSAFIRPIRTKRSNLIIRPNSWVTKIIIDPHSKRAVGVEYRTENSHSVKRVFSKKEIILSAGTIDSAKLLMLSGVGPADNLEESGIPLVMDLSVGKNLHNHLTYNPIYVKTSDKLFSADDLQNDVVYWLSSRSGPLIINPYLDNLSLFQTSYEKQKNVPDFQVVGVTSYHNKFTDFSRDLFPYSNGFEISSIYLTPKSRGEIRLDPENPIGNQPLIYPNLFSHPQDMKALAEGAHTTQRLLRTEAFKNSGLVASKPEAPLCDHLKYDTFPYYNCLAKNYTLMMYHFVGTCKMGPESDSNSVVDSRLRVRGIKRLRVIDASIMPEVTRGNTHAPSLMIGEKGSDMIKQDYSG